MNLTIDENPILFTCQHLYKAAIVFAIVRWTISCTLKFIYSNNVNSKTSYISSEMIRDSLELTTYGDLKAAACDEACAVCLNRMEEEDAVRRLRCCHVFHAECLDAWIEYDHEHVTCPLCRSALVGCDDVGVRNGPVDKEASWAVERMLYIFGEDDHNLPI